MPVSILTLFSCLLGSLKILMGPLQGKKPFSGSSAYTLASNACPISGILAYSIIGKVCPLAILSCHSTKSKPVTISVTGCSTYSLVFISIK
jgi:hypothetical protein